MAQIGGFLDLRSRTAWTARRRDCFWMEKSPRKDKSKIGLIDCHGRREGRFDEIWMDGTGERSDLPRWREIVKIRSRLLRWI